MGQQESSVTEIRQIDRSPLKAAQYSAPLLANGNLPCVDSRPYLTRGSPKKMEISSSGRFQRLKAVCVITHGGDYLFSVGVDPLDQRTFLVPVGGGIEFGELALTAAVREVREQVGIDVENPHLLGVLENIFTYKGETDHEVVFCFIGQVRSRDSVPSEGVESDGVNFPLRWLADGELRSPDVPVYPEGILDLILSHLDGD